MMASTYSDHSIERILDLTPTVTSPFVYNPKSRTNRRRTQYSTAVIDKMEVIFEKNPYPDLETREKLSLEIGVPESKIQVWFQNRRTRRGRTKARRGPRTSVDLKQQERKSTDYLESVPVVCPLPVPAYPLPPLMMSRAPVMFPTPLMDYYPMDWTRAWGRVQPSPVRPVNKLSELLIGELRSYESNSSSSTTEDSHGEISV